MTTNVWTAAAYNLLAERCGDHTADLDEFCEAFAKVVGAKSGGAVKVQLRLMAGELTSMDPHCRMNVFRKAAAYRAGIVEPSDFKCGENP
jgi:hypothetical protein